jgi:iron complex outermembrane receptor protein
MKLKMKSLSFAVFQVVASGALASLAIAPAMAQDGNAAVQRVVVTGSLISRTDTETPTPVQVLTSKDIQASGKTSIAELLSDLAANGAGTLGTGFSGAFANGASGVSLRGLTVGATLVLVDGHRLAPYPLGDDSQRSFVDVSSIPFEAIDSIEVLKSGASSLYGSDAIAGVVNIKLKKSFKGTRVNAETGTTQHGGGKTNKASITTGFGDLDADGYTAFVTAEVRKQGSIKLSQREQFAWDQRDWRSRGGNDLTLGVPTSLNSMLTATNTPFLYNPSGPVLPGTNPATGKPYGAVDNPVNYKFLNSNCNFDLYRAGACSVKDTAGNIQPASQNINILAGVTTKLGQDWELGVKGSIFQRNSVNNRGAWATFSPTSFVGNTTLANGVLTPGVNRVASTLIPVGNALNPFSSPARLYGYIPGVAPTNETDNTATTSRLAADLHGSALGWNIDGGVGATQVKSDLDYSGYIYRAALYTAINNGTFNPLGGNSQAVMDAVSPQFSNKLSSKLNYADLVGSRELMQLGAGPLAVATGLHWHKRSQNSPPPALTANGTVANTSAYTIGDETNTAAFAEVQATPIKELELHVSGRLDHYDTYGNSFTPAASFKFAPMKELGFRGTFARGFRAPTPAEMGNAGKFFTFNAINDPILCADGQKTTKGNVPTACGVSPTYVQTTNKDLSPEKSKSYTFGIIVEPVKGLNATLDYYNIDVGNQIISAAGTPGFVANWVRGPATPVDIATGVGTGTTVGTPSVGPMIYAPSTYVNAGSTKTSGLEADISYKWRMADKGTLKANLSYTHVLGYSTEVAGKTYELAGTQGPSIVSGATGNPKNRAQFTLGYNVGAWDMTATTNFTGGFSTTDPSLGFNDCARTGFDVGGRTYFQGLTQPGVYCRVSSFTTTNLNVQYKVTSALTLKASILNAFDRQPPIDVATYGNASAQTSYNASLHQAGAIGRFFSVGANYAF